MKVVFFFACFVYFVTSVSAEVPEKIYPKTKLIKPIEYYGRQASLWSDVVKNTASTAEAWLNYYLASKYAQVDGHLLDKISLELTSKYPQSFEAHFVNSLNANSMLQSFESLRKAYAVQPDNILVYGSMVVMKEYEMNSDDRASFSRRLFETSLISSSLLNYSYNVLMSVEKDAVLFTDSDNTTLPLFVLQDVFNVRTDVVILNLDLLQESSYRERKLQSVGVSFHDENASKQELCASIPEQNPSGNFYYALTLSRDNILPIKDHLYVVGLASQLSTRRIDNISQIKNNLENRFLMDYLTVDFNGENEHAAGKVLNSNYLVPFLLLLDHYKSIGDGPNADALQGQIIKLAKKSGKSMLVENFLQGKLQEDTPFIPYKLDTKAIEGTFKPVKDNIYAQEYEVTNKEYNAFLAYLKTNNRTDLFEKSRHQLDQYEEPARSFMIGYHSNREPTKKFKYFLSYPVVNITYDGALAYCEWLTEQYNHSSEKKYKRVKFRLPTLNEWQVAAAGIDNPTSWKLDENTTEVRLYEDGKEISKKYEVKTVSMSDPEILYPWFHHWHMRKSPLNIRGCSLGNFKFPEDQRSCLPNKMNTADGFLLMAPVQSYFPNDEGLYDVVGNVAEMISDRGKACGGSWNHKPEESTIRSVHEFSGATSDVGFRVFMEVIEP